MSVSLSLFSRKDVRAWVNERVPFFHCYLFIRPVELVTGSM